jgi:hypothetical protein
MNKCMALIAVILLSGCGDDRKCLKSHTETSCQCICSNNVAMPMEQTYEQCDLYEEKTNDKV